MVKPGYKQTEIGVIPEDWSCVPLLSKCELLNGLTYTPEDVKDFGLLVIRSSNIQNNQLIFDDNVYVGLDVPTEKLIKKNDIVICVRNGSTSLIGKCAKANLDYPITFGAFMAVLRGENNNYIFQLFQQGTIQRNISKSSGATINQITNTDFKNIIIPIPENSAEQHRIADALSDMDELIESLEKLIAKKKAIKQGLMQDLLTGKRRLPGFTGEWKTVSIGECGFLSKESINPMLFPTEYFWEYSMPAFDESKSPYRQLGKNMHSNRNRIIGNVLLFNKLNVRQKRIWLANHSPLNSVCSTEFLPYYSDVLDLRFLKYILETDKVTSDFVGMSTGTSNSQKRITPDAFLSYTIHVPNDLAEQQSIADALEGLEEECHVLEKELNKARRIKQGMMQQLLTGKIRLV